MTEFPAGGFWINEGILANGNICFWWCNRIRKIIPNLYGCGLLQFRDVYFVVHFLATPGKYIFVWSPYIVKQVSWEESLKAFGSKKIPTARTQRCCRMFSQTRRDGLHFIIGRGWDVHGQSCSLVEGAIGCMWCVFFPPTSTINNHKYLDWISMDFTFKGLGIEKWRICSSHPLHWRKFLILDIAYSSHEAITDCHLQLPFVCICTNREGSVHPNREDFEIYTHEKMVLTADSRSSATPPFSPALREVCA